MSRTDLGIEKEETEWVEAVEDGRNVLAGNDENRIIKAIKYFNPSEKQKRNYGNGRSAEKIVKLLGIS